MLIISAVLFVTAMLASGAAIPAVTRIALRRELLDYPDGSRRSHRTPVPRLGGVAVFAGMAAAAGVALIVDHWFQFTTPRAIREVEALGLAMAVLFTIGLVDDLKGVRPWLKLAGQAAAALIVCASGLTLGPLVFPPEYVVHLGVLSVPLTVVWLVGVSNAFNLIDGLDGLAGGVALISLVAVGTSAVVLGDPRVAVSCLALAGALIGFLRYNIPPARIFLGDSGSLVVGFLLAYLSIRGATRQDGSTLALVPIFALSYPLLDTGIAVLRRWLRGDPLSRADGRHIHHQLRALELTPRAAVAVIFAESAVVAVLGLSVTFARPEMTVAIACSGAAILIFIFVYGVRWLEYHEFMEAGAILASGFRRTRGVIRETIAARDFAQAILTADSLDRLQELLPVIAAKFQFAHIDFGPPRHAPRTSTVSTVVPFWKFEYPVTGPNGATLKSASGERLVLTMWCAADVRRKAASVERLAQILGPALGSWEAANAQRLPRVQLEQRTSGGRRASNRGLSNMAGYRIVGDDESEKAGVRGTPRSSGRHSF